MKTIKKWIHDKLKWGFPKERTGGDGFQTTYSCEYCHSDLAQDSTGAWFHLTD